jgi:hypothetical protein
MWTSARWRGTGFTVGLVIFCAQAAMAGPYSGVPYRSSDVVAWASSVESIVRGPMDIAQPGAGDASFGLASDALGPPDAVTVSLGDGGTIVLGFDVPVGNGPGDDFAVFENGFYESGTTDFFGEFAFVEVSSNGVDFARFEPVSLRVEPVGAFATVDPTDYDNLAGDQPTPYGTGFDLAELTSHPLVVGGQLDLQAVQHIRLVDVIGDGSTQDTLMNPIHEPYPTPFPVGGFDADAVGIMHVPEPTLTASFFAGLIALIGLARRRTRRTLPVRAAALAIGACLGLGVGHAAPADAAYVVDFEDQGHAVGEFYNGADFAGGFASGPVTFENSFTDFGGGFSGWTGFSSSAVQDVTTPGFANQYAAYDTAGVLGSGAGDSLGYGVFYSGTERLVLPKASVIEAAMITNTTYAALSMANGDAFSKQFGGVGGDDPDWLSVTFTGYDELDAVTGEVEVVLADYRFLDNALDYIIDAWTLVDLTGLGTVKSVGFSFDGSDQGSFGLNTPSYFAIDDIQVVPEPATALLLGAGLVAIARRRHAA